MKRRTKQACVWMAVMLGAAGMAAGGSVARAAEVGVADLSNVNTAAPEAWGVVPSPNQYRYQKEELAAFCHFGPNTFNEIEWGENYGDRTPDDIFTLEEDFDAETLVKTIQEAGFKKLIVTAKHHDGFCIWASDYTTYDVANTSYKNGNGDILAEISAACTKYDLDMGLYLSPWDIHEPSYGYYDANGNGTTKENDALDYNEYYNNQLQEILGSEKYGNNGHFVEVWMDGAKGSGANAQEYDFQRWFATIQQNEGKKADFDDDCMLFGAQAYTTVRWIGNELGFANEETWSKSRVDYENNTINSNTQGKYTVGFHDGNQWTVPEADASITSGWFWGTKKCTPKSIAELGEMYFKSVGHNAPLLLNVPPNNQGTVDQAILDRVKEFGQNIKDSFDVNFAANATVTASEVRGNDVAFSPANVLDGNDDTYWTMNDGTTTGSLTLDLGGTKTFDLVTIEEAIQLGQRISGFSVEYKLGDGEWKTFAEGTTIGAKRICRDKAVKADKVRINITGSYAVPLISEVGLYKASEGFEVSSPVLEGLEVISVTDTDVSDGAGFTYTGWTAEAGSQFIGGNSMWANSGASATLKFTGTKVWLYGTKDPKHGTADIFIDDKKIDAINTNAAARATGQMLYESPDLDDGVHTLRIVNTGTGDQKAIGLDAAAVLNNGGKGIVEFAEKTHEMEEDTTEGIVVRRIGGSSGRIEVVYENNPGSAVQGHYDVDGIRGTLVFEEGETEKEIEVTTKRYQQETGDLDFTVDLIRADGGALLGRTTVTRIIIHDTDVPGRVDEAKEVLEQAHTLLDDLYETEGIDEVRKLVEELSAYLENHESGETSAVSDIVKTASKLRRAMAQVSAAAKFYLPVGEEVKTIEAEAFVLDPSQAKDKTKYVRITENSGASGNQEVNWFEEGNRISLDFHAPKAGTYHVKATYRSGRGQNNPNAFNWSGTNVESGSLDVYGEPDAPIFHTAEFDIHVTDAGDGELVFTADSKGGPVIDKFEIAYKVTTVAVTGVSLIESELQLTKEKTSAVLHATVAPENATNQNVTFTSSNPAVATVTDTGLVTAVANGETVITVTTEDGKKTAQCTVTVVLPETQDNQGKPGDSLIPGDSLKPADSLKPTDSEEPVPSIQEGKVYHDGKFSYRISSLEDQTVEIVGVKKKGITKIKAANMVKLGDKSFRVTAIGAAAFKNCKKAVSVTIGKNITTIGKNAFAGCTKLKKVTVQGNALKQIGSKAFLNCKKLKTITIKSKALKRVDKNAFKGIHKKAVIKVPAAKLKKYKMLLAKKGQSRTVKIKK